MKHSIAIVGAALVAALPGPAGAQAASFTLVNNTDVSFTGLMVRRYGTQQWLPLVVKPLPLAQSGGSGAVDFSDPDCAFDLQATLPNGQIVVWPRVNLCEAKIVTLNRSASGQLWVDYR
jgi:hypothetical protein